MNLKDFEVVIAFTGHRPKYLPGGYNFNSEPNQWLKRQIQSRVLSIVGPYPLENVAIISGMALGVDQWALAWTMKVLGKFPTYIAAIPCKNQESQWPQNSQEMYNILLNLCDETILISNKTYKEDPSCMKRRNIWMVDHCTHLIGVCDPSNQNSGTMHAIKHAINNNSCEYYIINPNKWEKHK